MDRVVFFSFYLKNEPTFKICSCTLCNNSTCHLHKNQPVKKLVIKVSLAAIWLDASFA